MSFTPLAANRAQIKICALEDFGAIGDGTTDDSAAMTAAAAALSAGTYNALILGAKTYLVSGVDPWPMGVAVIGQGAGSILKTTTNGPVFRVHDTNATNRAKVSLFADFVVDGNSTGANQNAIEVGYLGNDGTSNLQITNVTAMNMGGRGFSWAFGQTIGKGPQLIGCQALSCGFGFYAADQCTIVGCDAVSCGVGVTIGAGNVEWIGGNITGSTTKAIDIIAGANNGHGIMSGAQINHNPLGAITIGAIVNGFTFQGCHIYQTPLTIDGTASSTGLIAFEGGTLDVSTYSFTNCSARFDCKLDTAYFTSYTESGIVDVEWTDACRKLEDNTIPTWVGQRRHLRYTFASDANQTFTAQQSRAEVIDIQSGVVTATRTITLARPPNQGQFIAVKNGTAQSVSIAWSTGTSVTIATGKTGMVGADGTNAVLFGGA